MKPNQFIKVQVLNKETEAWVDITNGILSIDSVTGSDTFQGYWDQPDTGQFVITSRGNTADPNLNPLITTSSLIKVFVDVTGNDELDVFYGFITDVNVEYRKNDTQIVTINGTDFMGYLNRLVVTQEFIDTQITPTYPDQVVPGDYLITKATYGLAPELNFFYIYYTSSEAFTAFGTPNPIWQTYLPTPAQVKVEAGKTLYELISLSMSSGLMRYESTDGVQYSFMPYYKNDVTFYNQKELELLRFNVHYVRTDESEPWQYPYEEDSPSSFSSFRTIKLNNGLGKVINQVSVSNIDPETQASLIIDPLSSEADVTKYGPALLNGQTSFTTSSSPFWLDSLTIESQAAEFQNNIIFDQSKPETTIESITIDMSKYFSDSQDVPDNGQQMWVQHKLPNGEYIKGYFKIAGIRHTIDESNWTAEFILRPSEFITLINNRPKVPTFTFTADEEPDEDGNYTTATNFTVAINNYTSEDLADIANIEWVLNFPFLSSSQGIYSPGTPPSEQNQLFGYTEAPITGITATWNYDDGGTFGPSYPDYWGVNITGPGYYLPYVYITDINGFKTNYPIYNPYEEPPLSIVGAFAQADFTFTKDAQQKVTFIDASAPDTNTWTWDFGDGTTYNGKTPPVKQYSAADTYDVSLTVNNGFDTDTITKPVTIDAYQIPVKYVRLRFQGSVTRPAGETEYPVDLIDTIALLEMKNESFTQTGGIQPFNIVARTLDKVQDIGRGNFYQNLRIFLSDTPPPPGSSITTADAPRQWVYAAPYTYSPYYTTDYSATSVLNPMSQAYWFVWNEPQGRGTAGSLVPKYRLFPVITNNPDGSQTKTYDFDLIFDYSKTYNTGTYNSTSSSIWRSFRNNSPAGLAVSSELAPTYIPGGNRTTGTNAVLRPWTEWDTSYGTGATYDQRYKLKEINVWPGLDTIVNEVTEAGEYVLPGGNTTYVYNKPVGPPLDRFGLISSKEYLPISISVSDDGVTYRKIGEAEYVSGNGFTTTYDVAMPPFSTAPIEA